MKKLILAILLLLSFEEGFSQAQLAPISSKDYFSHKSKKQQTTAWILLGTGSAAVISGVIMDNSNKGMEQSYTGGFIEIGGILCSLISVPFFLSAAHNRRKAASITLVNELVFVPKRNSNALTSVPSVSLKIKF